MLSTADIDEWPRQRRRCEHCGEVTLHRIFHSASGALVWCQECYRIARVAPGDVACRHDAASRA